MTGKELKLSEKMADSRGDERRVRRLQRHAAKVMRIEGENGRLPPSLIPLMRRWNKAQDSRSLWRDVNGR